MKIVLNEEEVTNLIKKNFPKEMIPDGYIVTQIELTGETYNHQFEINMERKKQE